MTQKRVFARDRKSCNSRIARAGRIRKLRRTKPTRDEQ